MTTLSCKMQHINTFSLPFPVGSFFLCLKLTPWIHHLSAQKLNWNGTDTQRLIFSIEGFRDELSLKRRGYCLKGSRQFIVNRHYSSHSFNLFTMWCKLTLNLIIYWYKIMFPYLWSLNNNWHTKQLLPRQTYCEWNRAHIDKFYISNSFWASRVPIWYHSYITNLYKKIFNLPKSNE